MQAQAHATQMSGKQLIHGRFDPQGVLVRDAFGEVLAAIDQKTGKLVSLRVLPNGEVGALVRRQVKAIGTFQHPNVGRAYGVVTADSGVSYLVQSPVAGHHLADYVAARRGGGRPISVRGAYNVISHVCSGLTALHASGPHGALRPTCVWIGTDGRVQITDVALSRAALAAAGFSAFAPDDQAFLAPEIKAGQPASVASDVFGAGALLYVLLTGRSPAEEFIAPTAAHAEVTPALEAELYRALSPDPAQRHPHPDALREALLAQMAGAGAAKSDDFGVPIEVEISLASVAPPRGASASIDIDVDFDMSPEPDPRPSRVGQPEIGARVSIGEAFRPSQAGDPTAAAAARDRRSLGEVDLKGVLAKITEDDSARWMVVKNGMDHGPFSGRQLVAMIVQGECHPDHELMNTDTGRRDKVSAFAEFQEFLAQVELRKFEKDRAQKLAAVDVKEKYSALFKIGIGGSAVLLLGLAFGVYAYTRSQARSGRDGDAELDMYRRGEIEISGSAGILPTPRAGARRSSGGGGGGGGGGGLSYEDAMMQAVEMGGIGGGGEQQLSAGTVAGVMNKHLNQLYNSCVKSKVGSVKIDMAITGGGQVIGVSVGAGDAGFQRCISEQVRRIRFPSFAAPRMGARYSFGT